jgi:hypothetical protein
VSPEDVAKLIEQVHQIDITLTWIACVLTWMAVAMTFRM